MMAIVVKGDALNPEQVQKAFDQIEEVDAVVSTIGGTPADPAADSQVPKLAPGYCFVIPAALLSCLMHSPCLWGRIWPLCLQTFAAHISVLYCRHR